MFISRSIKQDFCYRLWAQCSSLVTGVECRVKNNNSLTCLNDDTEPTHAFPWGHVPMGEKMTVPGSSRTSNNTNNFWELMLLQVVKNPPDALLLWKKQLMGLEEPSMQEGKGNMHPPRGRIRLQGIQVWEQGLKQIPRAFPWPLKPPSSVQSWRENSDELNLVQWPGYVVLPSKGYWELVQDDFSW